MASAIEIAWVAGFIEGEGCFSIRCHSPSIRVAQVNPEPLYKLKSILGGFVNFYRSKNPKHRDYYIWGIGGSPAAGILMTIYCLLSDVRKKRAKICLAEWKKSKYYYGIRNGEYCSRGHRYTPENTYIVPKRKRRECRTCRNEYAKKYQKERKVTLGL